jgi:hypothetical protein
MKWVAPYLIVGDSDNNVAYRFTVSSGKISVVDSLTLDRRSRLGMFTMYRNHIVAPESSLDALQGGMLSIYDYPKGGTPIRTISGMRYSVAVAISLGPKGDLL